MSDAVPIENSDFEADEYGSISYRIVVHTPRFMSSREVTQVFEAITLTTAVVYYAGQRNFNPSIFRLQGEAIENTRAVRVSYGSPISEDIVQILSSVPVVVGGAPVALYTASKAIKAAADALNSAWKGFSEAQLKSIEVKKAKLELAAAKSVGEAVIKTTKTPQKDTEISAGTEGAGPTEPYVQQIEYRSDGPFRPSRAELDDALAAMSQALQGSSGPSDSNLLALVGQAQADSLDDRRTVVLRAMEGLVLLARWQTVIHQPKSVPLEARGDEQGTIEAADSE